MIKLKYTTYAKILVIIVIKLIKNFKRLKEICSVELLITLKEHNL